MNTIGLSEKNYIRLTKFRLFESFEFNYCVIEYNEYCFPDTADVYFLSDNVGINKDINQLMYDIGYVRLSLHTRDTLVEIARGSPYQYHGVYLKKSYLEYMQEQSSREAELRTRFLF